MNDPESMICDDDLGVIEDVSEIKADLLGAAGILAELAHGAAADALAAEGAVRRDLAEHAARLATAAADALGEATNERDRAAAASGAMSDLVAAYRQAAGVPPPAPTLAVVKPLFEGTPGKAEDDR